MHSFSCILKSSNTQAIMYILVEFTDNSEIEVIPENWLDGNNCAVWPPYKTPARLRKAVQNKEDPGDDWSSFPVRVMYTNGN